MDVQLLGRFVDQYKQGLGKYFSHKWSYVNACIMECYLKLYYVTQKTKYLDFVSDYIEKLFDEKGKPLGLNLKQYNIDQIRMVKVLLDLNDISPDEKYVSVAHDVFHQLKTYPRTEEGSFWHKEFYTSQVWLDGLYMGQPFYTKYLRDFKQAKKFDDTIKQFQNCRKRIYDESLNLYFHAYDESRKMFWADKETGRSPNVWLRAIGWYIMALVDVIEIISEDTDGAAVLSSLLSELIQGMRPYRHESGMWYQVVDKGARGKNYLETSGSSMMAYGLIKSYRLGIEPKETALYGLGIIDGIFSQYIREENEEIILGGICSGAGLGMHPYHGYNRDGSFKYYTEQEKIDENNGHGVAPLFMAYAEYLELTKKGLF